jgi:FKBP-type peptidyl-prolyl cis-trans isomerase (trigger factor)
VIEEIINHEKIVVSDNDRKVFLPKLAKLYGIDVNEIEKILNGKYEAIDSTILHDKVYDLLIKNK